MPFGLLLGRRSRTENTQLRLKWRHRRPNPRRPNWRPAPGCPIKNVGSKELQKAPPFSVRFRASRNMARGRASVRGYKTQGGRGQQRPTAVTAGMGNTALTTTASTCTQLLGSAHVTTSRRPLGARTRSAATFIQWAITPLARLVRGRHSCTENTQHRHRK